MIAISLVGAALASAFAMAMYRFLASPSRQDQALAAIVGLYAIGAGLGVLAGVTGSERYLDAALLGVLAVFLAVMVATGAMPRRPRL